MDKTIGIIGAMDIELEEIKKNMTVSETITIAGMEFLKGTIGDTNVVLVKCGIGKVFASACTQAMILTFKPDYIINTGVCGSLTGELKTGDVVLGEKVLQYDMDTSAVGDPIGLISGINKIYFDCDDTLTSMIEAILKEKNITYKKGVIATGDKFINDSNLVSKLRADFNAVGGDMESGSIGHVCYINDTPFAILRSMSDSADENSNEDYGVSLDFAVRTNVGVIMELLK